MIKIYDGIAGSGKTTKAIDEVLSKGESFLYLTSTNKLKSEAFYKGVENAKTIASGLFSNNNGRFYTCGKKITGTNIIIDEILQTSPNVFKWIVENEKHNNIWICTDSKQTLAQDIGDIMLSLLFSFEKKYETKMFTFSHRAKTEKTLDLYNALYRLDSDEFDGFDILKKYCKTITYMPEYDINSNFCVHSNNIEKIMYAKYKLYTRNDIPFLTKNGGSDKSPILSQIDSEHIGRSGYRQVSNIGSVMRFQGTTFRLGASGYFIYEKGAKIGNRETYTLATRFENLSDLTLVELPEIERHSRPKLFFGKPVLEEETLYVPDGMSAEAKEKLQTSKNMNCLSTGKYYSKVVEIGEEKNNREKINGISILKDLSKYPYYRYDDILTFYERLSKVLPSYSDIKAGLREIPNGPKVTRSMKAGYGVDLFSSYPTAWRFMNIPDYTTYNTDMIGDIHFFCTKNAEIVCTPLEEEIRSTVSLIYICSFKKLDKSSDVLGTKYYELAHKSIEDKAKTKAIKWGILARQPISPIYLNCRSYNDPSGFTIDEKNAYFLLFVAIISQQTYNIIEILKYIKKPKGVLIDCVYFDDDPADVFSSLKENLGCCIDYRIFENIGGGKTSDKPILFKTYELKSKSGIAREKTRERVRKYRKKRG